MFTKLIFIICVFYIVKTNSDAIEDAQAERDIIINLPANDIAESINEFDKIAIEQDATANAKSKELVDSLISQIETADSNECVQQQKESLEGRAEAYIQEIVTCELDVIKEAKDILGNIQNRIQRGITDINREIDEVRICDYLNFPNLLHKREICINVTSSVLSKKVASVKKSVGASVDAGKMQMEPIKIKWEECSTSRSSKVTEIEDEIVLCIVNTKIN